MTESNILTDCAHLETSNNSFEEESEHNVTDYLLPKEYVPGSDLISKAVSTDTRIINIISKSLVNAPEDQYNAAPNEFLNKCAYDVLYLILIFWGVNQTFTDNIDNSGIS